MSNTLNFITFGCWNQSFCNKIKLENGMSHVMNALDKEKVPEFYIVSGDNYYPDKIKKKKDKKDESDKKETSEILFEPSEKKIFNENNFNSGFSCLYNLLKKKNVPAYLLMGNHDLQYEDDLYGFKNNDDHNKLKEDKLDKCTIIDKQLSYVESYNNLFKLHDYIKLFNKNTSLIVFINSSFYTDHKDELFDCFIKYRYANHKFKDIDTLIKFEESFILLILNHISKIPTIKNVIVVGHEPIVSRRDKYKNGKFKPCKQPLFLNGIQFLNSIYDLFSNSKKFYICAHVHQYQCGTINLAEHTITQYVVGTGGTTCDEDCPPTNTAFEQISLPDEPINLKFKLEICERYFGYLKCYSGPDLELNFQYVPVFHCDKLKSSILSYGKKYIRKNKKTRKIKTRNKLRK